MLRYRCRNCSQVLQAHELRAGKTSVCTRCLAAHTIPADRSEWLNDADEQLTSLYPPAPEEEPGFESSWSVAVEPPPAAPAPSPPQAAPADPAPARTPA